MCVLGAGTMGAQIAAHLCNAEYPVSLLDVTTAAAREGLDRAGRRAAPGNTEIVPVVVKTKSLQDPVSIPVVSADEYSEIDRLADAPRDTKPGSSLIASAEAREAFAMGDMSQAASPPALALLLMTFAAALAGAGALRFFALRRRSRITALASRSREMAARPPHYTGHRAPAPWYRDAR